MSNSNYSVDDGHGNNLAQGLSEERAFAIAQDHADGTGLACLVYEDGADEADEGTVVEPRPGQYVEIGREEIPAGVRFDVPGQHQGQAVEVAYGGFGRYVHDDGAPYKRVLDRSDMTTRYYRLRR